MLSVELVEENAILGPITGGQTPRLKLIEARVPFLQWVPPPKLPSNWVSHNGVQETLVACPEIQNWGQNARGTANSQSWGNEEALICQKIGIRGIQVGNAIFDQEGHRILATRMAVNSANLGTIREITGNSDECPAISGELMGCAYLGALEMEVQNPPSIKNWRCSRNA
jgi:hypothetical protein